MADLDYAFLADYATVESGKLTVVGASYTHVKVVAFPAMHSVAVAGRVRVPEDVRVCPMGIRFESPGDDGLTIDTELVLQAGDAVPYRGRIGIVFAATFIVPIDREGLYWVDLNLDGKSVRRLAFEASVLGRP